MSLLGAILGKGLSSVKSKIIAKPVICKANSCHFGEQSSSSYRLQHIRAGVWSPSVGDLNRAAASSACVLVRRVAGRRLDAFHQGNGS